MACLKKNIICKSEEEALLELTALAGLKIKPEIQKALIFLLREDVSPITVCFLLKEICNKIPAFTPDSTSRKSNRISSVLELDKRK
ncbi:hypothetical protein PR048_023934 [Dryococelus australis]|uniref:Uncharacterized protein n=1 Tax=Dryococelus australis TaxID=614101 RepID=A0ABQ9GVH6_9NEOP|nr:hypothetical protein PR048_023934 [Dryococelus australis]